MELIEHIINKSEMDFRRCVTLLPDFATDVDISETEDEVVVSYVLYERGEVYLPMGHC